MTPTTRVALTAPTAVGAKVMVKLCVELAASVAGNVGRPATEKDAEPATPTAFNVTAEGQTLRTVKGLIAERQPVCTVPKSESLGEMTMQAGLAVVMHVPPLQTLPAPHATQAAPLWPHEPSLGVVTQVLPLQQPEAQVVALQAVPPVQTPPVQVAPLVHAAQAAPLSPQVAALCAEVATHVPPEQQPVQLKKSHAEPVVHTPLTQELPDAHMVHAAPLVPQLAADWLAHGTQRFPEQQPMGQVLALQVPVDVHWPIEHVVPLAHA